MCSHFLTMLYAGYKYKSTVGASSLDLLEVIKEVTIQWCVGSYSTNLLMFDNTEISGFMDPLEEGVDPLVLPNRHLKLKG